MADKSPQQKEVMPPIQMAFIVCMGRSGSTLLQHLFDAHSLVVSPIESKFVLHLRTKYKHCTDWSEQRIEGFINDVYTDRKFRLFWKVERSTLRALFDRYAVRTFADACKLVYLSHDSISESQHVRLIVDKNPAYSFFTPWLREVFPDATIVHLVRDPRAVMRSQLKSLHKKSVYVLSRQWNFMNGCIIDDMGEDRMVLRYETLVQNPTETLTEFLGAHSIAFEEGMLNKQQVIQERVHKEKSFLSLDHHHNVANPVNTDSLDKWKSELSAEEIAVIDTTCYTLANTLGYPLKKGTLSTRQRLKLRWGIVRMHMRKTVVGTLFRLPFWMRKAVFNFVSFFFDKRYQ